MVVQIHVGIWSAQQRTNCEIRQACQGFFGCLDQKPCDSTSQSDLALFLTSRGAHQNSTSTTYEYLHLQLERTTFAKVRHFYLTNTRPASIMLKRVKFGNCSVVCCIEPQALRTERLSRLSLFLMKASRLHSEDTSSCVLTLFV